MGRVYMCTDAWCLPPILTNGKREWETITKLILTRTQGAFWSKMYKYNNCAHRPERERGCGGDAPAMVTISGNQLPMECSQHNQPVVGGGGLVAQEQSWVSKQLACLVYKFPVCVFACLLAICSGEGKWKGRTNCNAKPVRRS